MSRNYLSVVWHVAYAHGLHTACMLAVSAYGGTCHWMPMLRLYACLRQPEFYSRGSTWQAFYIVGWLRFLEQYCHLSWFCCKQCFIHSQRWTSWRAWILRFWRSSGSITALRRSKWCLLKRVGSVAEFFVNMKHWNSPAIFDAMTTVFNIHHRNWQWFHI